MADWGYPYEGEDQVMRKRRFNCRHPEVVITSHLRERPPHWTAVWYSAGRRYTTSAGDLELLLDELWELVPAMADGRWPATMVRCDT